MARKKAGAAAAADDGSASAIPNATPENDAECFIEAREIKSAIARLSQKLSATYARFENLGVDTKSVKDCLKLEKDNDPPGRLKRILTMASILNIIPTETEKNGQISVMPGLSVTGLNYATKEKLAQANAYNDGYNTGLAGGTDENNQFEPGTELRVKWSLGHIDGQAQRAINRAHKPEKKARTGRAATAEPETELDRTMAAYRNGGTRATLDS